MQFPWGYVLSGIILMIIMGIMIKANRTIEKKYIKRKWNHEVDYKETTIYLHWNVLDSINVILGIYTSICVFGLSFLVMGGLTIESPVVQFLACQSVGFVFASIFNLSLRISKTIKSIQCRLEG
ncbi:hypothetical protein ACI2JA_09695 [Alkalihalobacillus sp. NPDC078783]